MKLTLLKSISSLLLLIFATNFIAPNVYADAYIRKADENNWHWSAYLGNFSIPPDSYTELNPVFGNALFMRYYPLFRLSYVGLPGEEKRGGVFKLHRSKNGEQGGPREDLVLPSKEEAVAFCDRLIVAAHRSVNGLTDGKTIFASDWGGAIKKVIAVGYRVAYDGEPDGGRYDGKLTPAKKYWMCPNPWKGEQDPTVTDENELAGVKASGLGNSDLYNADTDVNGLYHVVCADSKMPETEFIWFPFRNGHWSDGTYSFTGQTTPDQDELDATLGAAYCSGQLR